MRKTNIEFFFKIKFGDWISDEIEYAILYQSEKELFVESKIINEAPQKCNLLFESYEHSFSLGKNIDFNCARLFEADDSIFFFEFAHLLKKEFVEEELYIHLNNSTISHYFNYLYVYRPEINEDAWILTFDILPSRGLIPVYVTDLILPFRFKESLKRFLKKGLPALIYFDLNKTDFFQNLKDNDVILENIYQNIYFSKYENLVDDLMSSDHKNFERFIDIIINSKSFFEENATHFLRFNAKKVCHLSTFSFDYIDNSILEKLNQDITLKIEFLQELNLIKLITYDFETKIEFQGELEIVSFDKEYLDFKALFNSLNHKELLTEYFDFLTYIRKQIDIRV
jgi:hypothetical protein